MNKYPDPDNTIITRIKRIRDNKRILFEEGNPYYVVNSTEENCFYVISYHSKYQLEVDIVEGVPHYLYRAGSVPMFYYLMIGYKPHCQLLGQVIKDIVLQYRLNYNFELRANTFASELSSHLSSKVLENSTLVYAVTTFVFGCDENQRSRLHIIEPDGSAWEKTNSFLGGIVDRETVLGNILEKKEFKEQINLAYKEISVRTNDPSGISIFRIIPLKGKVQKISKEQLSTEASSA